MSDSISTLSGEQLSRSGVGIGLAKVGGQPAGENDVVEVTGQGPRMVVH